MKPKTIQEILEMFTGYTGYDYTKNPAKKISYDIDQALQSIKTLILERLPRERKVACTCVDIFTADPESILCTCGARINYEVNQCLKEVREVFE